MLAQIIQNLAMTAQRDTNGSPLNTFLGRLNKKPIRSEMPWYLTETARYKEDRELAHIRTAAEEEEGAVLLGAAACSILDLEALSSPSSVDFSVKYSKLFVTSINCFTLNTMA